MTKIGQKPNRADRLNIAARIVKLSDQRLSTKENKDYIALQIGNPPNCNAVIVSDSDRVKFRFRSNDLVVKAKEAGFAPEESLYKGSFRGSYWFCGLGMKDLQAHDVLFRDIVQESVNVVMDRIGRKEAVIKLEPR